MGLLGPWGEGVLGALTPGSGDRAFWEGSGIPGLAGVGEGDSDSPVGGGLVVSSDAWVSGGFRGCLLRSPRLGGRGPRTANLKGLRGLD